MSSHDRVVKLPASSTSYQPSAAAASASVALGTTASPVSRITALLRPPTQEITFSTTEA